MRALSLVRNTVALTALSALALGGSLTAASAQDVFYTAGTSTIDATQSVLGNAWVGLDAQFNSTDPNTGNPYNATVNVVTGGSVGGQLDAFNSSQVNVSGGSVSLLQALNSSQVTVSGGSVSELFADHSSQVNVSGGSVSVLEAQNSSQVNVSGGSFSVLLADHSSQVNVSGGTFGQFTFGDGTFTSPNVNFYDRSSGGFTLIGHNLAATNVGTDLTRGGGTDYTLTGTLLDGTNLSGYVLDLGNASTVTLQNVTSAAVPELSSLLGFGSFLALGGLAAFRQRKTGRKAV
jgi:hypothetical protein